MRTNKQMVEEFCKSYKAYRRAEEEKRELMLKAGIVRNNVYEKLAYRADAQRHIEAYEMAIKALANGKIEERCFLGAPCRFQTPV